ncbi:VOC family protein [Sphingopyxis solisilvae]|uniref:VOC family protein n=1 Tax=Sphingopyxis solisilvae TaxID=1886788 RepID=UPI001892A323|nr:VOC family protein [Sphingopyxis solisilvae]
MSKTPLTLCLWYEGDAEEAANFYAATFADSHVGAVHRSPTDTPGGKEGDVLTVEFTLLGTPCLGLNGPPIFKHNEAFSFIVHTDTQDETDRLWDAITGNGGTESVCGWCKDKWGVSWQITPRVLLEATTSPDKAVAKRAFDAMMTMKKIDIAAIEAAVRG